MTIGTHGEAVIMSTSLAQCILDDLHELKALRASASTLKSSLRLAEGEIGRLRAAHADLAEATERISESAKLERELRQAAERKGVRAMRKAKLRIALAVAAGVGVGLAFAPLVIR